MIKTYNQKRDKKGVARRARQAAATFAEGALGAADAAPAPGVGATGAFVGEPVGALVGTMKKPRIESQFSLLVCDTLPSFEILHDPSALRLQQKLSE